MLTLKALEQEVRRLAEACPDATYLAYAPDGESPAYSCWYTKGSASGQVGCLIGQAIKALDPQMHKRIADYEEEQNASLEVSELHEKFVGFPKASLWLQDVQDSQDTGFDWSTCIEQADLLLQ